MLGMPGPRPDPFVVLGVERSAPDAEVRTAYRRLVQLHHPDHNGGSAESTRRFEEVQEAYAQIRRLRAAGGQPPPDAPPPPPPGTPPPPAPDPAVRIPVADLGRPVGP